VFIHGTQLYPSTLDLFTTKRIYKRQNLDNTGFNKTRRFRQVGFRCPTNDTCRVLLGMTYIPFYAGICAYPPKFIIVQLDTSSSFFLCSLVLIHGEAGQGKPKMKNWVFRQRKEANFTFRYIYIYIY